MSFYLIGAVGSEKEVRRTARKDGARLSRIFRADDRSANEVEFCVVASVPPRYRENLKRWFDESALLLKAAEAALPPEEQAIYKGRDDTAKLALDHKLVANGTVPIRILQRYQYIATPLRICVGGC